MRETAKKIQIIEQLTKAIHDERHQSYVKHEITELLTQRIFQIICGYEDANDSNELRIDPGFKVSCGRLPSEADLASQPTITRFENSISKKDLYRIAEVFIDQFVASYETPPEAIFLDIDDTDDETHGAQQMSLFNAYHDEYCYMPLFIFEGQTGKLVTSILRPGKRLNGTDIKHLAKGHVFTKKYIHLYAFLNIAFGLYNMLKNQVYELIGLTLQ